MMVNVVSDTVRMPFDKVFDMEIYEFLNIYCFAVDKANYEKQQIKKQMKHN